MTVLNGPWQGSTPQGRIRCVYTRTTTADHTKAIFTGTLYLETDNYLVDSANSWVVSGDAGVHTGTNKPISNPYGGGSSVIYDFYCQTYGDATVAAAMTGLEAIGVEVHNIFTLDGGILAPYFPTTNYYADHITGNAFDVLGINASGNGGVLDDVKVEYNTAANSTGSTIYTKGSYGTPTVEGLVHSTLYYFRLSVHNDNYGWSAWGPWKSVRTGAGLPGPPVDRWLSVRLLGMGEARIIGNTADSGGSPITGWDVEWNETPDETGSPHTVTSGTTIGDMVGLAINSTYYYRIRAMNINGYGPWTDWIEFATAIAGAMVKVGDVWKEAEIYVNVGGVWKTAERYVNVAGTWKQ